MEYELGVDEAGRGPVIGPMVYAACIWPTSQREAYSQLGFADSKKLSAERRSELFAVINNLSDARHYEKVSSSQELSNEMLRLEKVSLNTIAFKSAESVIRQALADGFNIKTCYLDTVGPPQKYASHLHSVFDAVKPGIEFIVEPKADAKYPVVSAASICAKVTRDALVEEIAEKIGDVGCGYPSDPKTVEWLHAHIDPVFGFDSRYVRVSWETCRTLMHNRSVLYQWRDVKEREDKTQVDTLFQKKSKDSPLQKILRLVA